MKTSLTLATLISVLCMVAAPAMAASLLCPAPVILPPSLNIQLGGPASQVHPLQMYLTNLRRITHVYAQANSSAMKDQLANCLMDHLATLPDHNSLQAPRTRADGASWFLLRDEVRSTLAITAPSLRTKPQMPFIMRWLNTMPQYADDQLATR